MRFLFRGEWSHLAGLVSLEGSERVYAKRLPTRVAVEQLPRLFFFLVSSSVCLLRFAPAQFSVYYLRFEAKVVFDCFAALASGPLSPKLCHHLVLGLAGVFTGDVFRFMIKINLMNASGSVREGPHTQNLCNTNDNCVRTSYKMRCKKPYTVCCFHPKGCESAASGRYRRTSTSVN